MPALGSLFTALFIGIAEFFAKWVTRKVAAVGAGIAIMAVITGALFVFLGTLVAGFVWTFPINPALLTGAWILIPDNAPLCVAAMFAADAAIAVYRLNVINVQFAVYAP